MSAGRPPADIEQGMEGVLYMARGRIRTLMATAAIASLACLGLVGTAQAAYDNVPTPTVTGPLPDTPNSYPFLATDIDLKEYGYVEEEFLYTGQAFQYAFDPASAPNNTATRVEDGGYPFKTRMIVRRPARAKDFNGVVIAEWMNVTALYDLEANWFGDPYYLLKNGYAFVGISAQNQGVSVLCCNSTPTLGLGPFNPTRYQGLNVNGNGAVAGDALSYDIYASGLKAVRGDGQGPNPLGDLPTPQTVVASGESQSCGRLGNQYNRIEPIHDIIDAYLLTVCTSPKLRSDRPEKAVRILSETETSRGPVDDPDGPSFRKWEVAGGSHVPRLAFDNWNDVVSRDRAPQKVDCTAYPLSLVQWPFTQNKAIADLVSWSRGGPAPKSGPSMEYDGSGALVRDEKGIAEGGIRYPEVEVPTGVNTGVNSQKGSDLLSQFCQLLGSYTAFPAKEVGRLHGNIRDFVTDSGKVADGLVREGFLLREDASRLKQIARQYPELRPGRPTAKASKKTVRLSWYGTIAPRTTFEVVRAKSGGKPKWKVVKGRVKGQKVTLKGQPSGAWVYAVRSRSRVELIDPRTNKSTFRTRITDYSNASKPVRVP